MDKRLEAAFEAAWNEPCLLGDPIACHNLDDVCVHETQQENIEAMKGVVRKMIVAALAAAEAAAWQSVETAPANEAIILCVGDFVCAGFKDELFSDPDGIGLFYRGDNLKGGPLKPQPTHWQPLPAPPTKEAQS